MANCRIQLLATASLAIGLAFGAGAAENPAKPLRGNAPVPETNPSGIYRMERHDRVVPRSHEWQPPIIPHNIKGYQITKNVNMCMVCHSAKAAPQAGATPVSGTHYVDRDNNLLPNISTRRYFCLQCHVPQFDAEPLVDNAFKSPR
jgi:nitrate reductase (cytochrome), electron transfer subunit